jgi:predicted nucleic acid-binding protein
MYILDTKVLAELMKAMGATVVLQWLDAHPRANQFTTALNLAEILYGLTIMPKGRRRHELVLRAHQMIEQDFFERVLAFDQRAAAHYADIYATRESLGRRIAPIDAQIAAVARANGMAVVTRNIKDFEDCGIDLIDPSQV